jgi:FkbM family methyltransferase
MLLGGIARFIDVGANDGISCSNTALAALRGARGLCFEPNPAAYSRLAGFYCCATRVDCIAQGLSDGGGEVELRCDGLLSAITATEDLALTALLADFNHDDAPLIRIPVERLGTWLDRRPEFQGCDLLSIDVEGHELNVLRGIDWDRHPKPARCLVIETHAHGVDRHWRHRDFDAIEDLLARHGYHKLAASRNNTFWLHREDRLDSAIGATKTRFHHYTWFA